MTKMTAWGDGDAVDKSFAGLLAEISIFPIPFIFKTIINQRYEFICQKTYGCFDERSG